MNEYEVAAYLADTLPEIKEAIKTTFPRINVFKSIQCLSDYTKRKVRQHDLRVVKKCFALAENIYTRGNGLVKVAIENVFVYSFSTLLNSTSKEEKIELLSLMPVSLYTIYVNQMLKSGT